MVFSVLMEPLFRNILRYSRTDGCCGMTSRSIPVTRLCQREKRHLDQLLPWSDDENVLVLEPATERALHFGLAALHLGQHFVGLTGKVLAFALPECKELPCPAKHSEVAVAVGRKSPRHEDADYQDSR